MGDPTEGFWGVSWVLGTLVGFGGCYGVFQGGLGVPTKVFGVLLSFGEHGWVGGRYSVFGGGSLGDPTEVLGGCCLLGSGERSWILGGIVASLRGCWVLGG